MEGESNKAVIELALFTKKAARLQAAQEFKLKCEHERADLLKEELEQTNAEIIMIMTEHKKGTQMKSQFALTYC